MTRIKRTLNRLGRYYRSKSIQLTISITFTLVAVVCMLAMGISLYTQYAANLQSTIIQDNQQLLNQISLNMTVYTRNMLRISDSMYYSIIKNSDLSRSSLSSEMNLVYELNRDSLLSVACFDFEGNLVCAAPVSTLKPDIKPTEQSWFVAANKVIENQHFSSPHVQNLFDSSNFKYNWAVSLSRRVTLTRGGYTYRGVLLVDMKYSGIEQIFTQMTEKSYGYIYLVDQEGEIIYHPKQKMIDAGIFPESNRLIPRYGEGIHKENSGGENKQIIVKSLSYTGWRLVCVIPDSAFAVSSRQMRLLAFGIMGLAVLIIITINSIVSNRVANPIKKLDESIRSLESGDLTSDIFIGGPHEIEHLGKTIRSVVKQMRGLMDDIIHEQELKRKSEFDALQSQINPHFLYNTLDSIVWMVESGRYDEGISMVTALANLFRIALSRGQDIITIKTELQHAQHYLYIQKIRYKNKFRVEVKVDPDIEHYSTIKLILQPLVENAIYYAMEYMDGDGLITIRGYGSGDDIYLEVSDNGLGMTAEKVHNLLSNEPPPPDRTGNRRRGSGIGLRNVHQRIRLVYGAEYGLSVESELDVGTTIRIHLPKRQISEVLPEEKQ